MLFQRFVPGRFTLASSTSAAKNGEKMVISVTDDIAREDETTCNTVAYSRY